MQVQPKEESKIRYTFEAGAKLNEQNKCKEARFTKNVRKIDEVRYFLGYDARNQY